MTQGDGNSMEPLGARGPGRGLSAFLLAIVAVACATEAGDQPVAFYAPPFDDLSSSQVDRAMWRFATTVSELQDALADVEGPPLQTSQIRIVAALTALESASLRLEPEQLRRQHPGVADQLGEFRARVARARDAAQQVPPDYTPASRIPDACMVCHDAD